MKIRTILIVLVVAFLALSCAPKTEKTAEATAPAATVAVVPADIKDPAAWTAAYDAVIAEYSTVASKINNGDAGALARSQELLTTATGLDAAAETIKAGLADQALADFTAKIAEYKEKFTAAAGSN